MTTSLHEAEVRANAIREDNNKRKLPYLKVQIWYKNNVVMDKIEAPRITFENKNIFIVPEIEEYNG